MGTWRPVSFHPGPVGAQHTLPTELPASHQWKHKPLKTLKHKQMCVYKQANSEMSPLRAASVPTPLASHLDARS